MGLLNATNSATQTAAQSVGPTPTDKTAGIQKPSMDVYYNQGSSEYAKQLAAYNYAQGDKEASWVDNTYGLLKYKDYVNPAQSGVPELYANMAKNPTTFNKDTGGYSANQTPQGQGSPTQTGNQAAQQSLYGASGGIGNPSTSPVPSHQGTPGVQPSGQTPGQTSQPTAPTPNNPNTYSIVRGDTLNSLAKRFNTTVDELMKSNPHIVDPNLIYAGNNLNVPGSTGSPSAPTPSGTPDGTTAPTTPTAPTNDTGYTFETSPLGKAMQQYITQAQTGDKNQQALYEQYAKMLEGQTKALDLMKQYEKESGLNELRAKYGDLLGGKNKVEAQLENLPEDVQKRVQDYAVNASQLGRLTQQESLGLSKVLNAYSRAMSETNTAEGFAEKTVQQYLDANKQDQATVLEALKVRLDAGEKAQSATKDIMTAYMNYLKEDAAANKPVSVAAGSTLVNPNTGKPVFEAPAKPIVVGKNSHLVYPDGNGPKGTPTPQKSPTPSSPSTSEKTLTKEMIAKLASKRGVDTFISPDDYTKYRNAWISEGGNPTTFDTKFKGYKNPNNPNYVTNKTPAPNKTNELYQSLK